MPKNRENLWITYNKGKPPKKVQGVKQQDMGVQHVPSGSFKCKHCKIACPIFDETKNIITTNTDKTYQIRL